MVSRQASILARSGALSLILAACAAHKTAIAPRVWLTNDAPGFYPELDDPALGAPRLDGFRAREDSFGVAFSGGGTRSASATLGQLRALHLLGWDGAIDYIAAVSGGSWASVPYVFRDRARFPDARFLSLDAYRPPERLDDDTLGAVQPGTLAQAIQDSRLLGGILGGAIRGRGDESWANAVSRVFLAPFGLDEPRLFTLNTATRDAIIDASGPAAGLSADDFYTADPESPFLVVGGVVLKQHRGAGMDRDAASVYPFVMTPLYVGVPTRMDIFAHDALRYGGGFIEAAGYDTYPPAPEALGGERVPVTIRSERLRFTLADVIGVSSSAPQRAITGGARGVTLGASVTAGFPEHHHWSLATGQSALDGRDVAHGDGGVLDNTGLLSLLARGTKNVLVFHNTNEPIDPSLGSDLSAAEAGRITDHLSPDLLHYFRRSESHPYNQLFDDADLVALYSRFAEQAKRGDGVLVYCDSYDFPVNYWHGVPAGSANICWVSLNDSTTWRGLLPESGGRDLQALKARRGEFVNFPNYKTVSPAGKGISAVDLSAAQVNALSLYTTWSLLRVQNTIREGLEVPL